MCTDSVHGVCWLCKLQFSYKTPYYTINMHDMPGGRFRWLSFCKDCWINMAGDDLLVEEDPIVMDDPMEPKTWKNIWPPLPKVLKHRFIQTIETGRLTCAVRAFYCPICDCQVSNVSEFLNDCKGCSTYSCSGCGNAVEWMYYEI